MVSGSHIDIIFPTNIFSNFNTQKRNQNCAITKAGLKLEMGFDNISEVFDNYCGFYITIIQLLRVCVCVCVCVCLFSYVSVWYCMACICVFVCVCVVCIWLYVCSGDA